MKEVSEMTVQQSYTEEAHDSLVEHVSKPQVDVASVNGAVAEAGQLPKLTAKQQEKQDKKEKEYWRGMVTRSELAQIIQDNSTETANKLQILYVQNATLLEVFRNKGLVTDADMTEASKKVMEDLFGILPEAPEEEGTK